MNKRYKEDSFTLHPTSTTAHITYILSISNKSVVFCLSLISFSHSEFFHREKMNKNDQKMTVKEREGDRESFVEW